MVSPPKLFERDRPAAHLTTEFTQQLQSLTQQLTQVGYQLPILIFLDEIERIILTLIRQYDGDFSAWWDNKKKSYSFSAIERSVYLALIEKRIGTTESIAQEVDLSIGEIADSLEVLAGTGVIEKIDDEQYKIGAKIFEQWVIQYS